MGNITIKGVLKDPSDQVAVNVPVLIISKVGYGDTLFSSQVTRKTDATGSYDFPLVYGTHSIAVRFYDQFVTLGTVVVNSSSTAEMTINELLELSSTEPPTPDWVVRIEHLTTEATAAAAKAENEADRAAAQVPLAKDQVTLAANEVVKATSQADRAKSEADRATQVTGLDTVEQAVDHALSEFAGLMTESEARATQWQNENVNFDASGVVNAGKQDANKATNVNEGLYVYQTGGNENSIKLGRRDDRVNAGSSKTWFPVTHIAGSVVNILSMGVDGSQGYQAGAFELPQAPDGTVIYDSTGDARGSGKASLDLKFDVDPKYGDVAADTNEAVARAFEGMITNGDFRNGAANWSAPSDNRGTLTFESDGCVVSDTSGQSALSGSMYLDNTAFNTRDGESYIVEVNVLSMSGEGGVASNYAIRLGGYQDTNQIRPAIKLGHNKFKFTAAKDATDAFLIYVGRNLSMKLGSVSIRVASEVVVTHPVDLVMLEYYEEELTGRVEIMECLGSTATTFGTTSVPTVLSTRKLSYFQQYDGQFDEVRINPDFINDRYRCVVWDDLTEPQKREIAAYMGERLFKGVNGFPVNGRLRARTFRGPGNGDWNLVNDWSSSFNYLQFNTNSRPAPQGVRDAVDAWTGASTSANYSQGGASNQRGDYDQEGLYNARHATPNYYAYRGNCYAYVVATVPRANQGAYHPDLNPWGCGKFANSSDGATVDGDDFWYEDLIGKMRPTTVKDCFPVHKYGGVATSAGVYAKSNGDLSGSIAAGFSGHPDGIFYDGIEAGGLNGVIDRRLPAEEMQSQWLYAERKHECAKYRGVEVLADNTSVSGKFMHTYKETVGGSITLPRTCLDSTVECVHSSDGGSTWTKTSPSVNQSNNTVTLPVGGESVVSFHTYAKQTVPSTNAPVVSGTFGLGPVMVQNSSDIKKGALLRESVTGVISTGTEYTNLGILRSTIVDELVIDYETMTYTPEAGGAQLQSQLVEENGQLFIQYHDGTNYHRSAIPIGWADQRARVGGENAPA
ncbi:coil containing protein [Vibrio phage 1.037.O._10N.261.52.F7]|nr:coil containing protein [Vibrio phage 1.037.O._10N.261.52.F7]